MSLTGSASRTDLSQLANGIWDIHAGCPSFLRVSSEAKIGYIPQFKASNARDQDEVSSDLARMSRMMRGAKQNGWYSTVRNATVGTMYYCTVQNARWECMVRNGTVGAVRWDIVWEERCDTVRQLQCVKVQCGSVWSKVRYGAMRCGAVSML